MNMDLTKQKKAYTHPVFERNFPDFGTIRLFRMDIQRDIHSVYQWVTQPHAIYWGMTDKSLSAVRSEYETLAKRLDYEVYIGTHNGTPVFLMEKYKATTDRISGYYEAEETDYGMHILIAPPKRKIHGFSWKVFTTILDYFFAQPEVQRIVVEPDVRNAKIHQLNTKAGFRYQKEIQLPEKKAALAFCDFTAFAKAKEQYGYQLEKNDLVIKENLPKNTPTFLSPASWAYANRFLIRKAIAEFTHELLFCPEHTSENTYVLKTNNPGITYEFEAVKKALDHWEIDKETITKKNGATEETLDAIFFVTECRHTLQIPEHLLSVYLEEITSTLSSLAYKHQNQQHRAQELANASFQQIEHAMIEGHPCFVANSGRIGFDTEDYLQYAPETDRPFRIYWVAGHHDNATYTAVEKYAYDNVLRQELGSALLTKFNTVLENLGLDASSYIFMPVHPWQWKNKIVPVFAADIARQKLVFLGESENRYSAQQSIRTLYNTDRPAKMYTKTALSIYNMGFMRGLSPYYMKSTPAITEWITELLKDDSYLDETGFAMLGEVATVGYENRYYEALGKTNAYNKMLSALWRESPHCKIQPGQRLMTMAALLHVDIYGNSLIASLIKNASEDADMWIHRYLQAYLSPLLHCFYHYDFVFMPHGENVILVLEDDVPVRILMKDITEEVLVFTKHPDMPEEVQRLYVKSSNSMKVLALFTDVFDSFFRFLSAILDTHVAYPETQFWKQVARCILSYQSQHPELQKKFDKYDLFVPEFDRCCLNRLQLRNTRQMLDLAAPIESLILEGTLQNPIAAYKTQIDPVEILVSSHS